MIKQTTLEIERGIILPVYHLNTVILGAGAAGMNCAVHLYRFFQARGVKQPEDRIAVVTSGVNLGASRMSGSDKQTYYKMGTSPAVPDSAVDFAKTLTAFGCMHGDIALAEAECSLREFYHLVEAGVPFPHDPEGAYIGYKTDHDPYERATSAGPKTSRLMSECLQMEAERYGIRIFDRHEAVHLLVCEEETGAKCDRSDENGYHLAEDTSNKRIVGLVTIDKSKIEQANFGLTIFLCENMVLAAGGPGELYEISVYPKGQTGIHGLAFLTGLAAHNLTESQFGLASIGFRWNVSGTYMQVIPRIFSTKLDGSDPADFLADFFPTTARMATCIFLKGYQWPFDPERILGHQSSLIDVLVHYETMIKGRRVYMDFTQNPIPGVGKKPFRLEDLEEEALIYLKRNGAIQDTPIARLEHMNPLAIDIYRENGIDIRTEPLEIALCAQHNNGGFIVDKWWQSSVPHTFVVGEMAGTHGVKRPGGSALNAGQVGSMRAAEYIANVYGPEIAGRALLGRDQRAQVLSIFRKLTRLMECRQGETTRHAINSIQHYMTEYGGHMRELQRARQAEEHARLVYRHIRTDGLRVKNRRDLIRALQAEHLALTQCAFLQAIVEYLEAGGGSRGSYLVLREDGQVIDERLVDPVSGRPFRFVPENKALRETIAEARLADPETGEFSFRRVPARPIPQRDEPFEIAWRAFRDGEVYSK